MKLALKSDKVARPACDLIFAFSPDFAAYVAGATTSAAAKSGSKKAGAKKSKASGGAPIKPAAPFDVLPSVDASGAPLMLLINPGFFADYPPKMQVGAAIGEAMKFAKARKASHILFQIGELNGDDGGAANPGKAPSGSGAGEFEKTIAFAADALFTAAYPFQQFRKEPSDYFGKLEVTIAVPDSLFKSAKSIVDKVKTIQDGIYMARDLGNLPGNVVNPAYLATKLKEVASAAGAKVTMYDEKALAKNKFAGHIAVGGGSASPPRMAVAHYKPRRPRKNAPHLALVGKGITFDTGGISLKPWEGMWLMKDDMAGAAAVIGAFKAICELKPDIEVTAIVCCAENMPDGAAYRPGDIFTYKNGKSVEIISTDAEGRLVLADGLIHACELGATHVVDAATLTGAAVIALGHDFTGLFANDADFGSTVKTASAASGDLCWEMPLPGWYREYLKSDFCDMKNGGGRWGGAITAAVFLSEFVEDGTKWCHLDIAPTFYNESARREYLQAGATGAGVRLLVELAESMSK